MVQTYECSLHPMSVLCSCVLSRMEISNLLEFYLIFIYSLEHIRYQMKSIPNVSNISTVIFCFCDIVEKCCTESAVTYNVI